MTGVFLNDVQRWLHGCYRTQHGAAETTQQSSLSTDVLRDTGHCLMKERRAGDATGKTVAEFVSPTALAPALNVRVEVAMSAPVQVFGDRRHEGRHVLRRPAFKKRQGTKRGEVWRRAGSQLY